LSAPVTVFTDELMAELVQKLPKDVLTSTLQTVLLRSQEKLLGSKVRNRRSDAYKAVLLARALANHVRPIPDELAVLLHEKDAAEVPMEGMDVGPAVVTPEEDFAANIDIPEFKQYASVFNKYPYMEVRDTENYGTLLVLGYCSGRGRTSNKLYRRDCIVVNPEGRRMGFKDLGSAIGVLSDVGPDGTHYTIKAIPYESGVGLKFWTNIVGEGDLHDQYRYLILSTEEGRRLSTACNNEPSWEGSLTKCRTERKAKGDFDPEPF